MPQLPSFARASLLLGSVLSLAALAQAQLVVGGQYNAASPAHAVWRVDVTNGQRQLLFFGSVSGLAVDDLGGRIFAIDGTRLSVWNYGGPTTATLLGTVTRSTGGTLNAVGLAYGGGRLFATTQFGANWLHEIDLNTLVATPVPMSQNLGWVESLCFDAPSGQFIAQVDAGDTLLYRVDILGTGAITPYSGVNLGIAPDAGALGPNNVYYVTKDDGTAIWSFNLATGQWLPGSIWSPYPGGLDECGAEWAPNLPASAPATVYCSPSRQFGCPTTLTVDGTPSLSAGSGFVVNFWNVRGDARVQPHFSIAGPAQAPFFGGIRCLRQPVLRLPSTQLIGNAQSCSGTYTFDFLAHATASLPWLGAGQTVWLQVAAQNPATAALDRFELSAGVRFTLLP